MKIRRRKVVVCIVRIVIQFLYDSSGSSTNVIITTFYTIRKWLHAASSCIINVFWWSSLKAFDVPLFNLVCFSPFSHYFAFVSFSIALFYSFMAHAYANCIYSDPFAGSLLYFSCLYQWTNHKSQEELVFRELNENANKSNALLFTFTIQRQQNIYQKPRNTAIIKQSHSHCHSYESHSRGALW